MAEKGDVLNPKGRPKKSFTLLNETLAKEGYEPLTKAQLHTAYSLLFALDKDRIQEIAKDDEQPLSLRLLIKDFLDPETRVSVMKDMREFLFGRASNSIDVGNKDGEVFKVEDLNKLSTEQLLVLSQIQEKLDSQ